MTRLLTTLVAPTNATGCAMRREEAVLLFLYSRENRDPCCCCSGERALRRIHHPSFRPVQSRSFSNDVKKTVFSFLFLLLRARDLGPLG